MGSRRSLLWFAAIFIPVSGLLIIAQFAGWLRPSGERTPLPPPRIVVAEDVFQFGVREPGEVVAHVFEVHNHGKGPLIFKAVRAKDPGSAAGHVVPHVIPPQGSAKVHTRINLRLPQAHVRQEIMVETNDPDNPSVTLALVGSAVSRVKVEPARLDLGQISATKPAEGKLEVCIPKDLAVKIVDTRASSEAITARVEKASDGNNYLVHVSVRPPLKPGAFNGWVHLLTDHPRAYKVIAVAISARVRADPEKLSPAP